MIQQIRFRAMGCHVTAIVDDSSERTTQALKQVPDWFEEWEQSLSRFRDDSELSQLNRSQGKPFLPSDTLWEMIRVSFVAVRNTGGLVTPAILPALVNAGYSDDFDVINSSHHEAHPEHLPAQMDIGNVHIDTIERIITLPPGMQLDFGGIAKGWAAQKAANLLRAYGPSLVNAGGDLSISAKPHNESGWPIGINDPFNQNRELKQINVKFGGVATSGKDYRKWAVDGQIYHHIIDPRTQKPAETDVLTATVIAPTTLLAEAAAKVILILGSEKGLEWIRNERGHTALVMTDNHIVKMTENFQEYLSPRPQKTEKRAAPHRPHGRTEPILQATPS